jgi:hypothetical protein
MKIPEFMDSADLAPDDPYRFGIDFVCTECQTKFWLASEDYHGQWDHPPREPICPACAEEEEE